RLCAAREILLRIDLGVRRELRRCERLSHTELTEEAERSLESTVAIDAAATLLEHARDVVECIERGARDRLGRLRVAPPRGHREGSEQRSESSDRAHHGFPGQLGSSSGKKRLGSSEQKTRPGESCVRESVASPVSTWQPAHEVSRAICDAIAAV